MYENEDKQQQVGGEETQGKRDGFDNTGLDDVSLSAHRTTYKLLCYMLQAM
jgi:hypothetical protein